MGWNSNSQYGFILFNPDSDEIYSGSAYLDQYNFKGLDPIFREKEGLTYRYFYGKTSNYQEARKLKRKARKSGYKSAFIVAFKNNNKVPLNSVIK